LPAGLAGPLVDGLASNTHEAGGLPREVLGEGAEPARGADGDVPLAVPEVLADGLRIAGVAMEVGDRGVELGFVTDGVEDGDVVTVREERVHERDTGRSGAADDQDPSDRTSAFASEGRQRAGDSSEATLAADGGARTPWVGGHARGDR